jgi:hypothetical protein
MMSILAATLKAPSQPVYEQLVCLNPSSDQQQWGFGSGTVEEYYCAKKVSGLFAPFRHLFAQ